MLPVHVLTTAAQRTCSLGLFLLQESTHYSASDSLVINGAL